MKRIIVKKNEANQRLDKLLLKYLNKAPKSFLYKMFRKKNITLNGKKVTGSERLEENDEIKLFLSDETIENFREVKIKRVTSNLEILYEDDNVLLINKPVGMLSQKAAEDDVSMVEYIISYLIDTNQLTMEELSWFHPSICNRLDRNTSGILIAGKSLMGLQEMANLLKNRSLHKYYRCVVCGKVINKQEINGYLSKNEKTNTVTISKKEIPNAEYICTEYTPIEANEHFSYVEVKLITGKTHQIRAHLASIGHPIAGDFKYGQKERNQYLKQTYGCKSQMLHSYRLEFPNCTNALQELSQKTVIAPIPKLFTKVLTGEKLC